MQRLTVNLGDRSYPIFVGTGALDNLPEVLTDAGARGSVAICTDSNVASLYAERVEALVSSAGLRPVTCIMPAGEDCKRLAQIEAFCGQFLDAGLDRSGIVIALGGGVVGDVAGFAAASYMRGIRYIQAPTTIVAQVDSSVGGKTAVNHPLAKNVIGAFHQPFAVIIDLAVLHTLPDREFRAGFAEVIKHGVIADEGLFLYLEKHARKILARDLSAIEYPVTRSCEIKSAIVAADEREHGLRSNLNYGHTFGHAIETVTCYRTYLHGEAVALGMHAAGTLAEALDMVGSGFVQRQRACLEAYGLPVVWKELFAGSPLIDETLAAMRRDKKAQAGTLKFILADRIGHVVQRTDIQELQVRRTLEALVPKS